MTREQRLKRLKSIRAADADLTSALLSLRNHYGVPWTASCFRNLYFLVELARKAP